MSFIGCLSDALKNGYINKKQFTAAQDDHARMEYEYRQDGLGDDEAARMAAETMTRKFEQQIKFKKIEVVAAKAAAERMQGVVDAGGNRPGQAIIHDLDNFNRNIEVQRARQNRFIGGFYKKFDRQILQRLKGALFKNDEDFDAFGRAMFGDKNAPAEHAALAEAAGKVRDEDLALLKRAGAPIERLNNYGLSTDHDAFAIDKVGAAAWSDFLLRGNNGKPLIDLRFMRRPGETLAEMYKSIVNSGLVVPGESGNLASLLAEHRVLKFGSYENWKMYNEKFGMSKGNPAVQFENEMSNNARSIAMLEAYGPNPRNTINMAKGMAAEKAQNFSFKDKQSLQRDFGNIKNILDGMTNDTPLNWAGASHETVRNVAYIPIAGGAFLAQVPGDLLGRQANARLINGLPAVGFLKTVSRWMGGLTSSDARQLAARFGVQANDMGAQISLGNISREHPILTGSRALTSSVARVFQVDRHMKTLPNSFALDFLANFARWKDLSMDELEPAFAKSMQREGITADDWDEFRKTPVQNVRGVDYIPPTSMLDREDLSPERAYELTKKMNGYVIGQAREIVPAQNLSDKYELVGNTSPNSLGGMFMRDAAIAKHFALSTMMMLQRGFALQEGAFSKAKYLGSMVLALTMASAMQLQAKALVSGRDPYEMDATKKNGQRFWGQALMRSMFFGPAIDMATSDTGGAFGIGKNIFGLGKQEWDYQTGKTQKPPDVVGHLFKLGDNYVPGANGWWSQLLIKHGLLDSIQRQVDPHAYEDWQKGQNFYQQNYGQQTWWQRGNVLPNRAPAVLPNQQK